MRLVEPQEPESLIRRPFVSGLLKAAAALGVSFLLHYALTRLGG